MLLTASESVTKLFRPSSSSNAKNQAASNSTPTMDAVSLVSNVSSIRRTDTEIIEVIEESSPDTSKTFPTPSTAIMGELRSLDSADAVSTTKESKHQVWKDRRDTPKRISSKYTLEWCSTFLVYFKMCKMSIFFLNAPIAQFSRVLHTFMNTLKISCT